MKYLIVAPSWVGDMMMSHSLYQTIKKQDPNSIIDVLALAWCNPLLKLMPEVNNVIEMPLTHGVFNLKKRYQIGKVLRVQRYDHAFILPNSYKSALIPWFAKIPLRTGWKGEHRYGLLNDLRVLDKSKLPQAVQRYVALAYPKDNNLENMVIPYPKLNVVNPDIISIYQKFKIDPKQKIIALCPGAEYGPAKCWPHYHYATLAKLLIEKGYKISLFGSNKDMINCNLIIELLTTEQQESCYNLAGSTSLLEAIYLLANCRASVANDSGLMHISAALNLPVVALYGPTTPEFAPPLTNKKRIIRLIDTPFEKIRKGDEEFGYHYSMVKILPELVMDNLLELLNE